MNKYEIAIVAVTPGLLVCVQLHYQDEIRGWWRRLKRNRARRLARRGDELAARRQANLRRMVSGGRSL